MLQFSLEHRKTNRAFADRIPLLALKHANDYSCHTAKRFEDLRDAYRLVYEEYLIRGYCKPKTCRLHYTYFCALPESRTFLLFKREETETLGTASLILNSPCGLPSEFLFPEQIRQLQNDGRQLAEVTLLAVSSGAFGSTIFSLTNIQKLIGIFQLFKAIFHYTQAKGITDLIVAVNPKHEKLYQYLTFEPISPIRSYSKVCGKPALLMRLDMLRFVEPRFKEQIVQKYFLNPSDSDDPERKSLPVNQPIFDRLFLEAVPELPTEKFLIFQAYLKASRRDLARTS
ncbi:MAG: hypothetical protein HY584_05400 [Candidatus Omnitrophica bacterium]|nr:hypothetical protein [Candidatus Omnitrophota bacterium]